MRAVLLTLMLLSCGLIAGCQPGADGAAAEAGAGSAPRAPEFQLAGKLESKRLDEASGVMTTPDGTLFLHNDEGTRLYFADATGRDLGFADIEGTKNRDWEDLTRVPGDEGPLLVIGDIGDNHNRRKRVSLYFVPEPTPGEHPDELRATHRVRVRYPDGPRDAESMAYDPVSRMILLLSKRDEPPRLYGVPLDLALWQSEVEAEFLAEVPGFRPPTRSDILRSVGRGQWVSQPTGMDISPDGRLAAVITYRSLYVFRRQDGESWPEAMQRPPQEFIGPPGLHDEAVGFSADGRSLIVASEGRPAPFYRLDLPPEQL
jgi:hypothetical protein